MEYRNPVRDSFVFYRIFKCKYLEFPESTGENVPIEIVAKVMKKDRTYISQGLISGRLPFVKTKNVMASPFSTSHKLPGNVF